MRWWALLWLLLFILTMPTNTLFLPSPAYYLNPLVEQAITGFGELLIGDARFYTYQLTSDSTGMYLYLLLLIGVAALLAIIPVLWQYKRLQKIPVQAVLQVLVSYYLAFQLLRYGVDKLFKHQFYLPEPNTLYTPLGQISPDLLYWSTMGVSYKYTVFAGLSEILVAGLLLFRKTRILGALLSTAIFSNVLMINIGFNLSVKLFSGVLLLMSIIIVLPYLGTLYRFFLRQENQQLQLNTTYPKNKQKQQLYAFAKATLISLLLIEVLWGYFKINNFNDDLAQRPFLHGAYELVELYKNGEKQPLLWTNKNLWKRVFIHRQGYFIVQYMDDQLKDYKLSYNLEKQLLFLNGQEELKYNLSLKNEKTILELSGIIAKDTINIRTEYQAWRKLPAVQNACYWTIDAYR